MASRLSKGSFLVDRYQHPLGVAQRKVEVTVLKKSGEVFHNVS